MAVQNMEWLSRAACRGKDPALWDTNDGIPPDEANARAAKEICAGCFSLAECGAYAARNAFPECIFAGKLPGERRP